MEEGKGMLFLSISIIMHHSLINVAILASVGANHGFRGIKDQERGIRLIELSREDTGVLWGMGGIIIMKT